MQHYKITPDRRLCARRLRVDDPAFGASIHDAAVALPPILTTALAQYMHSDDAVANACFLLGFPGAVADELSMSPTSVLVSAQRLLALLQNAGAVVPPVPRRTFSHGALLPRGGSVRDADVPDF
jgi:hypothetical protein